VSALSRLERLWLVNVVAFTAFAGVARYAGAPALLAFAAATGALAGLAWVVSLATEQVGERFGPAATGVLQSSVGNLPELFVVVFALQAHEIVVAQTAILGSIFANGLLVLGLVIVVGSWRAPDRIMRFHPRLPQDTATLLILTTFIIVLVSLPQLTGDPAGGHGTAISIVGAVCLLAVYVGWVVPYVRSEERRARETAPGPSAGPRIALSVSLPLLVVAGMGSAFVSDWFVGALQPSLDRLHLSQAFAGIVIVAIAGNAVENVAGIVLAARGQSDLAISVVKNSVAQIAAFLFPVIVLVSLVLATTLTFALAPIYVGALLLTVLALWQITSDGEATTFEGLALIALYVVLATVALYE